MGKKFDFGGWATKNDLLCSDGRIIRRDAFKECDGKTVPLVYQHDHTDPTNILGHALLENRADGVYAYCSFNNNDGAQAAKEAVRHGDVVSLSIYANKLVQKGKDVLHGAIREVSVVLAGANPGAYIDNPILVHGEGTDNESYEDVLTEAVIYHSFEGDSDIDLIHADDENDAPKEEDSKSKKKEEPKMADQPKGKSVKEIFEAMTDEEKNAVYIIAGEVAKQAKAEATGKKSDEDEGDTSMKHNVFEGDAQRGNILSHEDFVTILTDAKRCGSMKEAVLQHMESGVLAHADKDTSAGVTYATGAKTYGVNDMDMLFPEFHNLNNTPEWIKRDTGWVDEFFQNVHRTPFSRIKSQFASLTEDAARAKGYIKGKMKKEQVFSLLKRATTPQTIFCKQKMDRDDVTDITDFDVVAWIKSEMRGQLDEEIARACIIGDGRLTSDDDKIKEDNVRPVLTDNELFTIRYEVDASSTNENARARAIINGIIRARKTYKGSGSPIGYVSTDTLNDMLLMTDDTGRDLFKNEAELATKCRVRKFTELEQMEGLKYNEQDVLAIIFNPKDYTIGADKGGSVNLFDDFDIDYNQQKYLIETRCSGALTKPFSAIVILAKKTTSSTTSPSTTTGSGG